MESEKSAPYILDSDDEILRLREQHDVLIDAIGSLVVPPVDWTSPNLKILDSGTADGHYLLSLHASLPLQVQANCTFIGTDISPHRFPPPTSLPQNISFNPQSIASPWPTSWLSSFDLIHQRLTLGPSATAKMQSAVSNLVALLKPGGWVQLVEPSFEPNSKNGPAMRRFYEFTRGIIGARGADVAYARKLGGWLEGEGLVGVLDREVVMRYGVANGDAELVRKSTSSLVGAVRIMAEKSDHLPLGFPLDKAGLLELADDLYVELSMKGGFWPLRVVCGQRAPAE